MDHRLRAAAAVQYLLELCLRQLSVKSTGYARDRSIEEPSAQVGSIQQQKTQTTTAVVKAHSLTIREKDAVTHPPTAQLMNASSTGNHKISKDKGIAGSEVMTLQELATYLRIPKATIYRLVQKGSLPAFKVGRQWRVNLRLVQNYLVKNYERKTGRGGSA